MPAYPKFEVLEGSRIERFDERVIDRASNGAGYLRVLSDAKARWTLVHQLTLPELAQLLALAGQVVEIHWPPATGPLYSAVFSSLPEEGDYINPTTIEVTVKLEEI